MRQPGDAEGDNPLSESSSALRSNDSELATLREALEDQNRELLEACEMLHQVQETLESERQRWWQREAELSDSKAALEKEKRKVKKIWREKCDLQLAHKDEIDAKDVEIARLKARLLAVTSPAAATWSVTSPSNGRADEAVLVPPRRGKAPPINPFSAEGLDEQWDEWLPTFERLLKGTTGVILSACFS